MTILLDENRDRTVSFGSAFGDARISIRRWNILRSIESAIDAADVANSTAQSSRIRIGESSIKRVASDFIIRLSILQNRNEEAANDFVFADLDRLVEAGAFPDIEEILSAINVRKQKTSVLLSLLSITAFPAIRSRVAGSRRSFLERVRKHLMAGEDDVPKVRKLLYGLE